MNTKKIISIVLLALTVITLPLTLILSNGAGILFNKEKVSDLIVTQLVSDEALPRTIKEITITETLHGNLDKDFDTRMLVNVLGGIEREQWLDLFTQVLPEVDRIALVRDVSSGFFTWLDNDQPYPEIVIEVEPILSNLQQNILGVTTWIFSSFRVPPCEPDQIARYEAGDFGADPQALITCAPPPALADQVISATAGVIMNTLAEEAPPAEVNLADEIGAQVSADEMLAQKGILNTLRFLLPLAWLLPAALFLIAIGLVVRSVSTLIRWAQWPLFIGGALATLLALWIRGIRSVLAGVLLPVPEAIVPPPAAAIVLRLVDGLGLRLSSAMLWQSLPLFIIGAILLIYSYRLVLSRIPVKVKQFIQVLTPASVEEKHEYA
jgi:hypothetical protein